MSTTTTNYGLIKPDTTDPILIGQLNDNSDAIDAALKENADAIENKPDAADIPTPSTAAPAMDGTAAAGTSTDYARADHVHPSDTSKQDALSAAQLAATNSGIDSEKVAQYDSTTELEAEDRAALVELVNSGAKNLFQISANAYQTDLNGLTATFNADGSVTVTGTMTDTTKNAVIYISPSRTMDYRKYQGCVLSGGISANERIILQNSESPYNSIAISQGTGVEITTTIPPLTTIYISITKRSTAVNYTFKPMICTKAAWDISRAYQPYRPSYQELYERVVALEQANQ